MYLPQRTSTTIINGGDISGETGIEIRAADLIVNGGNITATYDNYESIFNDNGTTTKGIGIAVSQHTSQQPINVIINDGNIKTTSSEGYKGVESCFKWSKYNEQSSWNN